MTHLSEKCSIVFANGPIKEPLWNAAGQLLFDPRLYEYGFDMSQEVQVDHEHSCLSKRFVLLVLKFSFLYICLTVSGHEKESESTFDLNRGGRMRSIEEDKVSSGSTLNQAEKATSRYELSNNVTQKENDLAERTEEDESKVLNQELSSVSKSRDKRKNVTFKVTGDSAENASGSNNEMEEGIISSKGICFEAK